MVSTSVLQINTIVIGTLGGLALFLFGMDQMTDALKNVAGMRMKNLLARLTTNRFKAVFAGTFVTAIIQSSSVTTVLVVGFISAGLLTLTQSIGIILGADIGTTITAQIVAFKITQYALILIAVGFGLQLVIKQERMQQYGIMLMGLGMVFFGMNLMSEATRPLRTYQPFIELMQQMSNPFIGVLIGTIFTAIIQSSSATMGILIVLAAQGFITLEAGIALALGANIGTTITAILASIGKPRPAIQAAGAHVLFKVIGVIIWFPFIDQLAFLVRSISPAAPADLVGTAKLAAEAPRQIANAHTVFNVANTFIFIWFITPFARLMQHLIPDQPLTRQELILPKYLDDVLLTTPDLALDRVRLELGRLGIYTLRMVREALSAVISGTTQDLTSLATMDDDVDALHGAIITYLGGLSQENLLQAQTEQLSKYMAVANNIENIGDIVETNLVEVGNQRIDQELRISESTQRLLKSLHDQVFWAVEASLEALNSSNKKLAEEVMAAKLEINSLVHNAETHLARRLIADDPNRLAAFRIESEIVEYLKRVYYFAKRIAKATVDADLIYKQVELDRVPEELMPA